MGCSVWFSTRKGNNRYNVYFKANQEKVLENREKLFVAFLNLEKAYDRVPKEGAYWCMRKRAKSLISRLLKKSKISQKSFTFTKIEEPIIW